MTRKTRFKINIYRVNLRNPCLIFCYDRLEAQHAAPLLSQGLLYNLKYMEQLEHLSFKGQKALFVRLEELARIANMNKKERAEYEEALKIYRDNENVVTTARREGKEEGRKEGIELGRKEEKIQIALQMKRDNLPVSMIVKYSGLTEEEIANL